MSLSLEDFNLGVTLGTGSFGRVRFATYKSNDSVPCAIKMLKKSEVVRLQQVDHMIAEKHILASISSSSGGMTRHPFIVTLFAAFQDAAMLYMVLEYVNGGEFFSTLRQEGRLDNAAAKFYGATVATIFEHLHKDNIIYRDLKPENLLLDHQGFMKITDFGFAKVVEFKTYTLCGTPEYISPETLLNKGHGKGVDWWTLGILVYEMLAGQPPFVDDDPMGIYQQILAGSISFPRFLDRQAKGLIKKLLTADLTKRYGCLKRGAQDVKDHKWFAGFSFPDLLARNVPPPIQPRVSGPCDTSRFDSYPDSPEPPAPFRPPENKPDPFAKFDVVVSDPASEAAPKADAGDAVAAKPDAAAAAKPDAAAAAAVAQPQQQQQPSGEADAENPAAQSDAKDGNDAAEEANPAADEPQASGEQPTAQPAK